MFQLYAISQSIEKDPVYIFLTSMLEQGMQWKRWEQMNYIKELNAFWHWALLNRPSAGQVALWYMLMSVNNVTGWQEWFSVPNQTLQLATGLSRQGIDQARSGLIQKGLILYKKGRANQAGSYRMQSFVQNSECQIIGTEIVNEVGTITAELLAQKQRTSSTLFKQNKTKHKNKKKYDAQSPYLKMTEYFLSHIQSWATDYQLTETQTQNWADDFRKLHELDKWSKEEIKRVIDWVTQNDFWRGVILSPSKLRKKCNELQLKMRSEEQRKHLNKPSLTPQEESKQYVMDVQIAMNQWMAGGGDPEDQTGFQQWLQSRVMG